MPKSWHYARTELAEHYLDTLRDGPLNRFLIHAPRRKGKTEFLLHDLAPAAEKRGITVVFASMWDNRAAPHGPLLNALRSTRSREGLERLKFARLERARLSALPGGIGGELSMIGRPKAAPSSELSEISELIVSLAGKRGKNGNARVLLMLDEIQHLASSKVFDSLAGAIRTSVDRAGRPLAVVYTGSESATIRLMFQRRRGLFYNSAFEPGFPDMGEGYLRHTLEAFRARSRARLTLKQLRWAFNQFNHNPGQLMECLMELMHNPETSIEDACALTTQRMAVRLNYEGRYRKMKALDRAILHAVIENKPLFSKATRDSLGLNPPPKPEQVQRRVESLMKQGILMPGEGRGEYLFQDGLFRDWIETKLESRDG
jgi:hypothetical protein